MKGFVHGKEMIVHVMVEWVSICHSSRSNFSCGQLSWRLQEDLTGASGTHGCLGFVRPLEMKGRSSWTVG